MNDFFLKVTELGLQASILILAVMILRRILRRTPRWMVCLLWGVVALRLLCPIQVESPLSLQPTWTRNIQGIMVRRPGIADDVFSADIYPYHQGKKSLDEAMDSIQEKIRAFYGED